MTEKKTDGSHPGTVPPTAAGVANLPGGPAPLRHPRAIADRLHNTTCQTITAARFLLSALELNFPARKADLRKRLSEVDAILEDAGDELRVLIQELRAAVEDDSVPASHTAEAKQA